MGLNIEKATANKTAWVNVQVTFMDGTRGDFDAEFRRVDQSELDDIMEEGLSKVELLDRVMVGVRKIGRTDPETGKLEDLPTEEQVQFVKNSPEASRAACSRFFDV